MTLIYAPKKVPKSQLEILKFSIELPLSYYNNCNSVKISGVLSYRIQKFNLTRRDFERLRMLDVIFKRIKSRGS